jgi:hypothetical protein
MCGLDYCAIKAAHEIPPQKTQQNRVSRPSFPQNPNNSHRTSNLPQENCWHSSYAPTGTIKVGGKTGATLAIKQHTHSRDFTK